MSIPVIIPAYGKPEQLKKCRDHLFDQCVPCRMFVEDNNPPEVNRGFTKAVNDGLRRVQRRRQTILDADPRRSVDYPDAYAVILNQDAYLAPDAVEQMVHFMDAHPRCAIGGIKQVFDSDPDLIYHGGGADLLPAGQHYGGRVSNGDCNVSRRVGWVNGAALIVRMSALSEIGLMDEEMFLCGSDADWCVQAALRGWECWYIAEAVCRHEVGVSAKPPSQEVYDIILKDMSYFTQKLLRLIPELAAISAPDLGEPSNAYHGIARE